MNAEDALTIVKKERPELVLLDINLPDAGGLEVLGQVKKINPGIKVIMLLVGDDPDTIERAKNLGADEFVKNHLP